MTKAEIPLATQMALAQTMALNGALMCIVRANPSPQLYAEFLQAIDAYETQTLALGFSDESIAHGRACLAALAETLLEQLDNRPP